MKIVCDACSAQYMIADDKVPEKAFKIRCKQCGHFIVVHPLNKEDLVEPLVESKPASSGLLSVIPDVPMETRWYVVIKHERVGPFSTQIVHEKLRQGEITPSTYIWKEGFVDWIQVSAVAEFQKSAEVLPPVSMPVATASSSPVVPGENNEPKTNVRNENSVLFSISDLQRSASSASPMAGATSGERSGLIDIRALAAQTLAANQTNPDKPKTLLGVSPNPVVTPLAPTVMLPQAAKVQVPGWAWAIIVIGIVGALGLGGWIVMLMLQQKSSSSGAVASAAQPSMNTPNLPVATPSAPQATPPTAPVVANQPTTPVVQPIKTAPLGAETTEPAKAAALPKATVPKTESAPAKGAMEPAAPAATSKPRSTSGHKNDSGGKEVSQAEIDDLLGLGSAKPTGPDTKAEIEKVLSGIRSQAVASCKGKLPEGVTSKGYSFAVDVGTAGSAYAIKPSVAAEEQPAVDCIRSIIMNASYPKLPKSERHKLSITL